MLLKYEIKYIYVIFITLLFDIDKFRIVIFFSNHSIILFQKIDSQRFANNFTFINLSSQEHMTQLKIDRF